MKRKGKRKRRVEEEDSKEARVDNNRLKDVD